MLLFNVHSTDQFFLYTGVTGSTKRLGTVRDFFF